MASTASFSELVASMSTILSQSIIFVVALYAYLIFSYYKYGATVGCYLMGVRLARTNLQPASLKNILLFLSVDLIFSSVSVGANMVAVEAISINSTRGLKYVGLATIAIGVLAIIWSVAKIISFFVTKKRQTISNKISDTVVVYKAALK